MCLLMQTPTDISLGNKKQYTELSFSVGFFTKVSKNKELKYLLPFVISPTQVPTIRKSSGTWDKAFNDQAAATVVVYSQVAVLPVLS